MKMIISRSFPLRTTIVSEKNCRENENNFMFNFPPPSPPENRAVYEKTWKI